MRWASAHRSRPWVESTLRAAVAQSQVDPAFRESETAAYQVVDLRAGLGLPGGVTCEVGVENLLDQDYAEHLAREALFAQGDLEAGEKIPMPGRFFYTGIKWTM